MQDFETTTIDLGEARIFARLGGAADGPPLLLLHGYPETGILWARVAARLKDRFRLIVPDLRGYGRSAGPVGAAHYSKRAMAADMVALMARLGHDRFHLAGHDRGARVAYRLALDHPEALLRLAVLDILPTSEYWRGLARQDCALKMYHWLFLAQPYPLPETLMGAAPQAAVDMTLASWTAAKDLSAFTEEALAEYRAAAADPAVLRAMCDDYRAGASVDKADDEADEAAGHRIAAPTLALWGGRGLAAKAATPLEVWRRWCENVEGGPIDCGHFLPEEAPEETAAALAAFFAR